MNTLNIPSSFYAGDTVTWTESISAYPSSAGNTLKFALVGKDTRILLTSTATNDDHLFTISATDSAKYIPGWYEYQAYIENATSERYTIGTGKIEIKRNLSIAAGSVDSRSVWQYAVDNLELVIKAKSTEGYQSISISMPGGTQKQIGKMTWTEILQAYQYAKAKLEIELRGGRKKLSYLEFK